jgi:hypothetical protein
MNKNIPNGHKIYRTALKRPKDHKICIPTSSIARPSKIYPNGGFLFENMPSGNPGKQRKENISQSEMFASSSKAKVPSSAPRGIMNQCGGRFVSKRLGLFVLW